MECQVFCTEKSAGAVLQRSPDNILDFFQRRKAKWLCAFYFPLMSRRSCWEQPVSPRSTKVINGVSLEVQIVPLGSNMLTFKAESAGVDLTDLTSPIPVVLTIGIDSGSTTPMAR